MASRIQPVSIAKKQRRRLKAQKAALTEMATLFNSKPRRFATRTDAKNKTNPVFPGSPAYDLAPFEDRFVVQRA